MIALMVQSRVSAKVLKVNLDKSDLRNNFKAMEDKCISISGLAGDVFDDENG